MVDSVGTKNFGGQEKQQSPVRNAMSRPLGAFDSVSRFETCVWKKQSVYSEQEMQVGVPFSIFFMFQNQLFAVVGCFSIGIRQFPDSQVGKVPCSKTSVRSRRFRASGQANVNWTGAGGCWDFWKRPTPSGSQLLGIFSSFKRTILWLKVTGRCPFSLREGLYVRIQSCCEEMAKRIFDAEGNSWNPHMASLLGSGGEVHSTGSDFCVLWTPDAWPLNKSKVSVRKKIMFGNSQRKFRSSNFRLY